MIRASRVVAVLAFATLLAPVSWANSDRAECVKELQKVQAQRWCDSDDRKACLAREGAVEWCDGSAYVDAERKLVDARLNSVYRRVMTGLDDRQRELLRESQRRWLQFHTAECDARNALINGGANIMRSNIWQSCVNDFMKHRTTELQKEFCTDARKCQ